MRCPAPSPLTSHKVEPSNLPKEGFHSVRLTICPVCRLAGWEDEHADAAIEREKERQKVTRDIQEGRYVQRQSEPSVTIPQSQSVQAQSSAPPQGRPALTSKFIEVGLVSGTAALAQPRQAPFTRSSAVRGRNSSNMTQQVQSSARPAYGHKKQESPDIVEYYRSGASSGMAFEHPAVAVHGGSKNSQQEPRQAFDRSVRQSKPLPPIPLHPQKPDSGSSGSTRQPSIPQKLASGSSTRQPPSTLQKREHIMVWKDPVLTDCVLAQRSKPRPQQPPNLTIPAAAPLQEHSPLSNRPFNGGSLNGPRVDGAPRLRPAKGPQTPQISRIRDSTLNMASPLEGSSEVLVNGEEGDYFVLSHTGKAVRPSDDDESPILRETPTATVTRARKADRLEPNNRYQPDDSSSRTSSAIFEATVDTPRNISQFDLKQPLPKGASRPTGYEDHFPPGTSSLPQPHPPRILTPPAVCGHIMQPASMMAHLDSVIDSPPLLRNDVYRRPSNPPPSRPARDPAQSGSGYVGADIDFDAVEDMFNEAAAGAEARNRVAVWQGSSL